MPKHTLEDLRSGKLAGATRLSLSSELESFPTEIFDLADTLEVLDLSRNRLDTLPEDFGRLRKLKILFLSENRFTQIPTVLSDCPNLTMIGFKSNQIEAFPEDALPQNTRWLILTDNRIEKLPDSIGKLGKLQKLMLAGNRITHLPDTMQQCKNLELLRLSANRLERLPDWLFGMPKLSWLACAGNPCTKADLPSAESLAEIRQVIRLCRPCREPHRDRYRAGSCSRTVPITLTAKCLFMPCTSLFIKDSGIKRFRRIILHNNIR